ncbi:sigma 54-interacting transcriptional regulator [Fusobacterium perfoetens]|uniref:sigma-54 interaction domain-containing protein n=1 Tax=Fusobacterium perfoetens TaxID=852 RepID=UPI001F19481D|nr:sigma 54-interacting transcriptional regulator [Fusobacterium perfoetens]MCF2626097.1 sigma 54-interacting transcriptional regulator [Fusobacterium perfoetens]
MEVFKISLKIAVISAGKDVGLFYKKQLEYFFADAVELYTYSIEDGTAYSPKTEDIFLITTISFDSHNEVLRYIPKDKHIVNGTITVRNSTIEKLKKLPSGTKALLVNSTKSMCEESIVLLHQKGINNISFSPYYPGCKEKYEDIPLAITPGEAHFAPAGKEIIDIGNRVLDTNTILEIISFTDCEYLLKTDRLINYFDEISENNTGVESLISKMELATQQFNILFRLSSEGIILVDKKNNIIMCNQKANDFLEKGRIDILYKPASSAFQNNIFEQAAKDQITKTVLLLSPSGIKLKLKVIPIVKHGIYLSGIGIINRANPEDEIMTSAVNKILKKGHIARYTFDSIITKSKNVIKIKEVAKKMAKSNSAVLITGESGTGKELFAHSIHNYSSRRDKPFVAINCAALADNLLESELFGYEEGAFTGAKKGGKTGLFEIANNGTLFLDEIEGMSKNLQFKLLRVIQEKEIIKVGGDEMIPIDVRIIAASNENLGELVENKVFRQDLYYRLNTLPITIPPLRERIDDLYLLIEDFKQEMDFNFIFTKASKHLIENYTWPGNIRELRNCIEYLGCLGETIIEPEMFPQNMNSLNKNITKPSSYEEKNIFYETAFVIGELEKKGKSCGRKSISEELKNKNIYISEAKIRKILENMKNDGLISSGEGRTGSKLTSFGRKKFNIFE